MTYPQSLALCGIYSSQVVIEAERRLEDLMLDKCAFTIFGIVFRPD